MQPQSVKNVLCTVVRTIFTVDWFSEEVTQGQTAIVVSTAGTVKYEGKDSSCFTQTFTLTAQDNKWKITADCLRLIS